MTNNRTIPSSSWSRMLGSLQLGSLVSAAVTGSFCILNPMAMPVEGLLIAGMISILLIMLVALIQMAFFRGWVAQRDLISGWNDAERRMGSFPTSVMRHCHRSVFSPMQLQCEVVSHNSIDNAARRWGHRRRRQTMASRKQNKGTDDGDGEPPRSHFNTPTLFSFHHNLTHSLIFVGGAQ